MFVFGGISRMFFFAKPIRAQRYELFFENEALFRGSGIMFKKH